MATLAELIVAVGWPIHDNVEGITTADATDKNKMVDSDKAEGVRKKWNGSQALFTVPIGGDNPKEVRDFDPQSGVFTLHDDFSTSAGARAGLPYVLMRLRGSGKPFSQRLDAVRHAIEKTQEWEHSVNTTLTTAPGVYTYTVPLALSSVYDVILEHPTRGIRRTLRKKKDWTLSPGGKLLLTPSVTVGEYWIIELHGRGPAAVPSGLFTDMPTVNRDEVVEAALEYMGLFSQRREEQEGSTRLAVERFRTMAEYRWPGELPVRR